MSTLASSAANKPPCLVQAKALHKILYSEKPLSQGTEVQKLSHDEFKSKFGCEYTESLYGDNKELAPYLNNKKMHELIKKQPDLPKEEAVKERLENPLPLVICKMDDSVGHGVFTLKDIAPNSILCIYSGKVEKAKTFEENDPYCYIWIRDKFVTQFNLPLKSISSKDLRGISGFMQHLPRDNEKHKKYLKEQLLKRFPAHLIESRGINLDDFLNEMMENHADNNDELTDLKLNEDMKKKLATSNVTISQIIFNGIPIVVCWTLYGIKANQQVGFSYGSAYWARNTPRYFNLQGETIPSQLYTIRSNSNFISSSPSSLEHYNKAITLYKCNDFKNAINYFELALKSLKQEKGENAVEVGTCYSSSASCYSQINNYEKALEYCVLSIQIAFTLKSNNLEKLQKKLKEIIIKSEIRDRDLYNKSVQLYNNKNYFSAVQLLLFSVENFTQNNNFLELASSHSALASCFRELGETKTAIQHAQICLQLREKYNPKDITLLQKTQKKLDELKLKLTEDTKNVSMQKSI